MIYFLFVLGLVLFLYGLNKTRLENEDFDMFYHDASQKEEIKLVNHTLNEEALKKDIDSLYLEIEKLKQERITNTVLLSKDNPEKTAKKEIEKMPISYEGLSEKLKNYDESVSLEELAKEMNISKGELLLLKNLLKK